MCRLHFKDWLRFKVWGLSGHLFIRRADKDFCLRKLAFSVAWELQCRWREKLSLEGSQSFTGFTVKC